MADSGPQYAIEALNTATQAQVAASRSSSTGLSDSAFTLPSLTFKFKAPSFLGKRSRWVLFLSMLVIAALAIIVAREMATRDVAADGAEWVWPPIMTLIVAALALAFAYASVMGFGDVELSTSIGTDATRTATGLTVTDTVPPDGAPDIEVTVEIEATFSEAVDPASLTTKSFVLRKEGEAAAVPATAAAEDADKKGRLKPTDPLEPGKSYEVEITTDLKTPAGTALAAAKKWTFKTKA